MANDEFFEMKGIQDLLNGKGDFGKILQDSIANVKPKLIKLEKVWFLPSEFLCYKPETKQLVLKGGEHYKVSESDLIILSKEIE